MTTIRPMLEADARRVAELATQLGYPSSVHEVLERFTDLAGKPENAVLVATDARDAPIGWIHVTVVASLAVSDTALIGGLVVDDAQRSAGVGAALVAAGEAWAREHGARTMTVSSRIAREEAHRFYRREGYSLSKTSHNFVKSLV